MARCEECGLPFEPPTLPPRVLSKSRTTCPTCLERLRLAWRPSSSTKAGPRQRSGYMRLDGRVDYQAYLLSAEWAKCREAAFQVYGRKCSRCGKTRRLEVHHRGADYRRLGRERVEDLEVLCGDCHDHAHMILGLSERW